MPLLNSALSAAIKAEFASAYPVAVYTGADAIRQDFCDKLADALVTYLVANNLVTVSTAVGPGVGTFV